jgi:hypothetical protein
LIVWLDLQDIETNALGQIRLVEEPIMLGTLDCSGEAFSCDPLEIEVFLLRGGETL